MSGELPYSLIPQTLGMLQLGKTTFGLGLRQHCIPNNCSFSWTEL